MTVVRLLSGEPTPLVPSNLDPEMDHFLRQLMDYIRRLNGKFSGDNIEQAIIDEGSSGVGAFELSVIGIVKITQTGTIVIDSRNWTNRGIWGAATDAGSLSSLFGFSGSATTENSWVGKDDTSSFDLITGSPSQATYAIRVDPTNNGRLELNCSSYSSDLFVEFEFRATKRILETTHTL